jgi:hypothetical protein
MMNIRVIRRLRGDAPPVPRDAIGGSHELRRAVSPRVWANVTRPVVEVGNRASAWRGAAFDAELAFRSWKAAPQAQRGNAAAGYLAAIEREEKAATEYRQALQGQSTVTTNRGILQRSGERLAAHRRARLVSLRSRRRFAQWLRHTARDANDRSPIRRRHDVLLHSRATAVRTDLLEIAALLEQAHDPDLDCVLAIRELLANGDSPLYTPGVHIPNLHTTLDCIRALLEPGVFAP